MFGNVIVDKFINNEHEYDVFHVHDWVDEHDVCHDWADGHDVCHDWSNHQVILNKSRLLNSTSLIESPMSSPQDYTTIEIKFF